MFDFTPNALFLERSEGATQNAGTYFDWFPRNVFLIKTPNDRVSVVGYSYASQTPGYPISTTTTDVLTIFSSTSINWYSRHSEEWQFNPNNDDVYYIGM